MARKRKPPQDQTTSNNKRQLRARAFERVGSFRLLDLPPEIRNNIYAYVLQSEPQAFLTASNRGKLFSKSAMARTSRQVREEFTSLPQVASFELIAEVKNFNFAHVVTFLNKMNDHDLKTLPTVLLPSERRMTIKLIMPESSEYNWTMLRRWLNRLDHPFKKGSTIDFKYKAAPMEQHRARWMSEQLAPLAHWWSPFARLEVLSRDRKEKLKMACAFRALLPKSMKA